jgi:lysine/ornithine N-monooxygenase
MRKLLFGSTEEANCADREVNAGTRNAMEETLFQQQQRIALMSGGGTCTIPAQQQPTTTPSISSSLDFASLMAQQVASSYSAGIAGTGSAAANTMNYSQNSSSAAGSTFNFNPTNQQALYPSNATDFSQQGFSAASAAAFFQRNNNMPNRFEGNNINSGGGAGTGCGF